MNWLNRLIAGSPPSIAAPCPGCGNDDLLLIGRVSRAIRGTDVQDVKSGNVYRCPLCECAFMVTVAGVWRLGGNRAQVPTASHNPERKPAARYPELDPDLSRLMEQREP
jgi:hypothetical protein